jgi:hypothetical protein
MKVPRRQFLHLAAGSVAPLVVSSLATAQTYPSRPITIIVGYAAGGPTDTVARILAERMKAVLGQPVLVENATGAGGSIAVGRVVRAAPDGYTLSMAEGLMTLTAAPLPAWGQAMKPAVELVSGGTQNSAAVPDFSGIWSHPYFGVDPPISGPGPVTGGRRRVGFIGDYTNPILKPQAAEVVKKHGEIESSGVAVPNPRNQCWPQGVPFMFVNIAMQMIQQPHQITMLYDTDQEVRRVRMNQPHPAEVTPSWYGDSVGHYEGGVLVIDTVGIKIGPFAMLDWYGTPRTSALHVVEHYRLIDYEAAIEAQERGLKVHPFAAGGGDAGLSIDPGYKGKGLQLEFTVEDEGVFTMPWSATVTYRRGFNWRGSQEWPEVICAENAHEYSGKGTAVPHADRPVF